MEFQLLFKIFDFLVRELASLVQFDSMVLEEFEEALMIGKLGLTIDSFLLPDQVFAFMPTDFLTEGILDLVVLANSHSLLDSLVVEVRIKSGIKSEN